MKKEVKVVEETTSQSVENVVVEATASVEPKTESTLDALKAEMKRMAEEMAAKKAMMAESLKQLKEEAAKLKEAEKLQKVELKKAEAEGRAKAMAEALAKLGADVKVNMTEKIKTLLLEGMSLDEIAEETGWERKAISDRIWLIEKRLGLR